MRPLGTEPAYEQLGVQLEQAESAEAVAKNVIDEITLRRGQFPGSMGEYLDLAEEAKQELLPLTPSLRQRGIDAAEVVAHIDRLMALQQETKQDVHKLLADKERPDVSPEHDGPVVSPSRPPVQPEGGTQPSPAGPTGAPAGSGSSGGTAATAA